MPSGGQQDYSTPGNQGSSDSSIYYPDFGEGDPTNTPGAGDDPGYLDSQYPEMAQPPANELFGNAPDFGGGFNDWGSVGDDGSIYGGSGGQDLNLGDSADPSEWDADGRVGNGQYMANGGMRPGFKWTERVGKQLHAPAGGYTPLNLHPKPMMADGWSGGGVKVVNSPTKVKLAPGDQVVPLSFRPKAKIRPSAALPALQSAMRTRPMFGAQR